jgi:hypothetical protein
MHSNNLTKQNLCSSIPPTVYLHFKDLTKWELKTLFKNLTKLQKKDDHPDLNGLFLVTPALSDGAIFTSVTLNAIFCHHHRYVLFKNPH